MIPEITINICGQEVLMRYCAASETGFEQLTGHSAAVFEYTHEKDEDGKDKLVPPAATAGDYIHLAWASIAAAYLKQGDKKPPLTLANVLCDTTPAEAKELIVKVIELRNKWYEVPEVAAKDQDAPQPEDGEKPKNA
jgi:hypothetical protein